MNRRNPIKTCETYCEDSTDYVRVALAIEILAYHNKNYLWTGNDCKISEEVQTLLAESLIQQQEE